MVVASRDLAERLKDSVNVPVVEAGDTEMRKLEAPPELPEDLSENRTATLTDRASTERKNTTTTTTKRRKRTASSRTARRKG
jgi:hypothetical protein